ncbi:CalY family protein [Fictibacillus sp. Mic-4]|uniref:CalY family protein n=1 Tax=Fictibacillus TaxID=1329200 RepID=UPI00040FE345|nr:CalY family protein [Fictibacillus gelatini]
MNLKKKLGLSVITASLGLSLIGGGTYAYFNDTEVTNNTFAAGTLDLSLDPSTIIDVSNLKPGDTMKRDFKLTNGGTLKIKTVDLKTEYSVGDVKGNNGSEDLGKHIKVKFLWNWDKETEPIYETTLYNLKNMKPDVVQRDIIDPLWKQKGGLAPGASNDLWVQFEFVDNGKDQNVFQGDDLKLKWTFNATQTEGEEK